MWMFFFFFNDTATTEIYTIAYTLSLHDALPISRRSLKDVVVAGRRGSLHRACRDMTDGDWPGKRVCVAVSVCVALDRYVPGCYPSAASRLEGRAGAAGPSVGPVGCLRLMDDDTNQTTCFLHSVACYWVSQM